MNDHERRYDHPPAVGFEVRDQVLSDYPRAADYLNGRNFNSACLQHGFGIFGGQAGSHVMANTRTAHSA